MKNAARSQTYSYYGYHRLTGATETSSGSTVWSETFNYFIHGNRWVTNKVGITLPPLIVTSSRPCTTRRPALQATAAGMDQEEAALTCAEPSEEQCRKQHKQSSFSCP